MITVNDMYKESSSKDAMLLSSYTSDFWSDYRTNYKHYDKLFRRMFKSFKYFLQEDDETISDITTNFTDDVYNHLLINNKRYSELFRIHVIDDNNYSLTDNYNITETMNKDSSNNSTNTYGERTDTTNETEDEPAFNPAVAAATMRNEEIPVELIQDKPIIHKLYCSLEDL